MSIIMNDRESTEHDQHLSQSPPGLKYFNEVRKRLGFLQFSPSLAIVHIEAMTSLYYGACFRHMDSWRMSVKASESCYLLIKSRQHDWESGEGDLLKRAFWHCVAMEVGNHLELNLPYSSLMDLEQIVPLPTFSGSFCYLSQQLDHVSNFEHHYAALIALRRICRAFHEAMNHETSHSSNPKAISSVVQYHANQLERWKSILPPALQWDDARSALVDDELLFGSDIGDKSEEAARRKYVRDVQTALLRTRYYYARYMIYRPLIYKVLHFPKSIKTDDVYGVSCCLKSCLNWPLLIVPPGKQNSYCHICSTGVKISLVYCLCSIVPRCRLSLVRLERSFLMKGIYKNRWILWPHQFRR